MPDYDMSGFVSEVMIFLGSPPTPATSLHTDKHPDITGKATIDGVAYEIAGWQKEGNQGKFYSLKFQLPRAEEKKPAMKETGGGIDDLEDDIPF